MIGPIGVDNSEVINIEMERELRRKNRNLYPSSKQDDDDNNETEQEQEDKINEKLL